MKASELRKNWQTKDNNRVVKRQVSIRLPTHVAAKIQALCDMHPNKTKTDIIVDLLTSSLDEIYDSFEFGWGEEWIDERGIVFVRDVGDRKTYIDLANQHFREIEAENGNPCAVSLFEDHMEEKNKLEAWMNERLY